MSSDEPSAKPCLGFLGLGAMGRPMAATLVRTGYPVLGYDIVPERLAASATEGVAPAGSVRDVADGAGFVLTSLRSSAVFVQVAESDLLPAARSGQVFVDLGTTEARETRRLARCFAQKGAALVDAPVSGGPHGSHTGTLRIFVGGDEEAVTRCWPLLEALGAPGRVVYCGPSGCGQIGKGVNQLAMGLGAAAYLEALAFGVRAGVAPEALAQSVGGGGEHWREHFAEIAARVIEGTAQQVWVKFPELPYFLGEAAEQGFALPLTQALFGFCSGQDSDLRDNMGRPTVSFWQGLTTAPPEDDE